MNKPSEKENKQEAKALTARTVAAKAATVKRTKKKRTRIASDIGKQKGKRQKQTWRFFAAVVHKLKKGVSFEEHGHHTNDMGHGHNFLVDHVLTPQRIYTTILTCCWAKLVRMEILLQKRKSMKYCRKGNP
jgi:hypothetical protein